MQFGRFLFNIFVALIFLQGLNYNIVSCSMNHMRNPIIINVSITNEHSSKKMYLNTENVLQIVKELPMLRNLNIFYSRSSAYYD